MAENYINVTEGSGKKAHTFNRTIGANDVHDEIVLLGEQYLASYRQFTGSVVTTMADSHLLQIMAGASLKVYVRRIRVYQFQAVTTAAYVYADIGRLTTAGTGGTVSIFAPLDSADGASGASMMTLPTVKGTEGVFFDRQVGLSLQTLPATPTAPAWVLFDFRFDDLHSKTLIIPAGTTNGICVKLRTAAAGGAVVVVPEIYEANF